MVSLDFHPCQAVMSLSDPPPTTEIMLQKVKEGVRSFTPFGINKVICSHSVGTTGKSGLSLQLSSNKSSLLLSAGAVQKETLKRIGFLLPPRKKKYPQHHDVTGDSMGSCSELSHPSLPGRYQSTLSEEPEKSLTPHSKDKPLPVNIKKVACGT